jgi:transaldolase
VTVSVLSMGHSSLTLYIQLFLSGYGLELSDLEALRTWGSRTPGHPEVNHTPGVETTTGQAAVANAQLAYQAYQEVFSSSRWRALEAQGARTQRPLWASTGVKNQDYRDTLHVSDLIAPDTVNTMPEKTLKSYADHGSPGKPIQRSYDEAAQVMKAVADAGIDLDDVFKVLEDEGIQKFVDSWDELTESVRSQLEDKK